MTTLKAHYAPTWQAWEAILKIKVKLSVGRASELMALADGRKSVQEIRSATAQRVAYLRASRGSSLQGNVTKKIGLPAEPDFESDTKAPTPTPAIAQAGHAQALALIAALSASSSSTRSTAVDLLVSGSQQSQFETTTVAVSEQHGR